MTLAVSRREWTDGEGQRVVFSEIDGVIRISIYGEPSMGADDGHVAIGADMPSDLGSFFALWVNEPPEEAL
jgi:hypothetical protein